MNFPAEGFPRDIQRYTFQSTLTLRCINDKLGKT
jgi:hypothetical protein